MKKLNKSLQNFVFTIISFLLLIERLLNGLNICIVLLRITVQYLQIKLGFKKMMQGIGLTLHH